MFVFLLGLGMAFVLLSAAALYSYRQTLTLHTQNEAKASLWEQLEKQWRPLLDAYCAGNTSLEVAQGQIEPKQALYFIDYLMRYTLKHLNARPLLTELAAPYLPPLTARLEVQRGDTEQRARAVQTVSLLGRSEDLPLLARSLEDPSPMVVLLAARALAEHQLVQFTPLILKRLPDLMDWHLRFLVKMLIKMGAEALPYVQQHLETSDNAATQAVCLQVMASLSHTKAAVLAVRLLSESEDVNVQVAALSVLGKHALPEHLPLIRSHYHSPHFAVRLAVIRALNDLQVAEEQIFQKAVEDRSHWVAIQAAQALKDTGSEHVLHEMTYLRHPRAQLASQVLNRVEDLKNLEQAAQQPEFQNQVGLLFKRLQQQDPREVRQLLTRLFFHPLTHPDVRYTIACELEKFQNYQFFYQTLSSFILGFEDRRSLIRALRSFANPEAVPALIEFYRSGKASHEEKLEIVEALGKIDSLESLEFLSRIYNELFERNQNGHQDPFLQELQNSLASALAHKMF